MSFFTALLLISGCLTGAHAGGVTPAEAEDFYTAGLSSYSTVLASLPPGGTRCRESYAGLFRKDTLRISVFLGFIDCNIPDLALDGPIKRALTALLTRECPPGLHACGFASPAGPEDGPAALTKKLPGYAREKTVTVKIFDSSVSGSILECTGPLRGPQRARSAAAAGEYIGALGRDDIVLYMGHSRYGTGPGFSPVSFTSPESARIYVRRPLLPRMRAALLGRSGPPAMLGFIACNTEKYYAALAHSASPGSALLLSSGDSTHLNSAHTLLGAIDSVLGRRCSGDFSRSLNKDGTDRPFSLYGFFAENPHTRYHRHTPVMLILSALLLLPFLMILLPSRFSGPCDLPLGTPEGPFRGFVLLAASLLPGLLAAGLLRAGRMPALPLALAVSGCLSLALSMLKKRVPPGGLRSCAAVVLPPFSLAAAAYFCITFLPELSAAHAARSSLQTLRLGLAFAALLPFCLFHSDLLLRADRERPVKGFALAAALNLALYLLLALGLERTGPRVFVSLVPVSVLALYLHGVSFLLRRRFGNIAGPAFFQALTLALIITEGLHIFLYN